ncbi:MAG: carbohydrate kinase family protein [Anaerolineales bacterium]
MIPEIVLAGQLRREYIITEDGRTLVDVPGGGLLYAAVGARLWTERVSLLARVGEDYPRQWMRTFEQRGLDLQGVRILPETLDLRAFYAYTGAGELQRSSPVSHFVRLGLPFPKSLLGYQPPEEKQDSRVNARPDSPRPADIPEIYFSAKAIHLGPLDYLTHSLLAPAFRQYSEPIITIDPAAGYMNSNFLEQVRAMLQGVSAFLPSEEEIRLLYWGVTTDLWEMCADLTQSGCEIIVVKRSSLGQYVYDANGRHRWEIPAYPARFVDATGAGDAFCGGFIAGFMQTFDPLRAALQGNASASLTVEGSGAFYALDALPGLAQARLQSIASLVRKV